MDSAEWTDNDVEMAIQVPSMEKIYERGFNAGLNKASKEIAELEKENAELKERIKWYSEQICNKECAEVWGELSKAKNHIHRLLILLTEGKRSYAVIDEARAFLQEVEE